MIDSEAAARHFVESLPGLDSLAMDRLDRLADLLCTENARQNLVSAASLDSLWQRHVADSAQLVNHVPRETTGAWLDLGTGAGFPGLVIAVLQPQRELVMVESRPLRVAWLTRVIADLDLSSARVVGVRLEAVESFPCGVISARAFAPLDRLVALSARFSTSATSWLLPKGRSAAQELSALQGWKHAFHVERSLTDAEAGVIVGTLQGAITTTGRPERAGAGSRTGKRR